jgi:hypothetical protein
MKTDRPLIPLYEAMMNYSEETRGRNKRSVGVYYNARMIIIFKNEGTSVYLF